MKPTLTPLTTGLISSGDTRQHAAGFCSLARRLRADPEGQIKDPLSTADYRVEKLQKTRRQSVPLSAFTLLFRK